MSGGVTDFYGFEFNSRSAASPELNRSQLCFKYTLVLVNCLFLIFGCVLCALGAYAVNSQAGALAGASLPNAIIALGVFTILLAFLGCASSFFESRLALSIYFGVLLVICLLSFIVGIGILVEKNQASSLIIQGWAATPDTAKQTLSEAFGCCGFSSYCDSCRCYVNGTATACPDAVCVACVNNPAKSLVTTGYSCPAGSSSSAPVTCLSSLTASFAHYYQQAGGASIAFGVLMAFAMIIVCVLMRGIKTKAYLEGVRAQHRRIREAKEGGAEVDLMGVRTGLEGDRDVSGVSRWISRATAAVGGGEGGEEEETAGETMEAGEGPRRKMLRQEEEGEEEEEEEEVEEEEEEEEEVVEEEEEEEEEEPPPLPRKGRAAPPPPPPPKPAARAGRSARSQRNDDDDFS